MLEHADGFNVYLLGEASVLGLLPSSLELNATLDQDNIEDSVIHNFDVDLASGFFKLHANYSDNILQGNYEVPILWANGYARLEANDTLIEWYGEMSTFGGLFYSYSHGETKVRCALFSLYIFTHVRYALVICHWDLSYFYAKLGNLNLISVVQLNKVVLEVDARDEFALSFDTSITVFFLLDIDTVFQIKEVDADNWNILLSAEAELFGLSSTLSLNATLNTDDALESSIYFDMGLANQFIIIKGSYDDGEIHGSISIPVLVCHGQVHIVITDDGASFDAKVNLFDFDETLNLSAEWAWDMSYFKGRMDNFVMGE